MRVASLILGVAVLLVVVAATLVQNDGKGGRHVALDTIVPSRVTDWEVADLPLGDTESMVGAVKVTLNFDSYVYREFRQKGRTFSVYAAHWGHGKMPAQSIAAHSPDQCWVLAGWKCDLWKSQTPVAGSSAGLGPAEVRTFTSPGGQKVNVWYWHIIDGTASQFGNRNNVVQYSTQWLKHGLRQLVSGSPDQLFIRISSTDNLEQLAEDGVLKNMVENLGRVAKPTRS